MMKERGERMLLLLVLLLMTIDIDSQDRVPPTPSLFVSTRLCLSACLSACLPALFQFLPRFLFRVFVSCVVVISGERKTVQRLSLPHLHSHFSHPPRVKNLAC